MKLIPFWCFGLCETTLYVSIYSHLAHKYWRTGNLHWMCNFDKTLAELLWIGINLEIYELLIFQSNCVSMAPLPVYQKPFKLSQKKPWISLDSLHFAHSIHQYYLESSIDPFAGVRIDASDWLSGVWNTAKCIIFLTKYSCLFNPFDGAVRGLSNSWWLKLFLLIFLCLLWKQ